MIKTRIAQTDFIQFTDVVVVLGVLHKKDKLVCVPDVDG